jgi:hypothetical protein
MSAMRSVAKARQRRRGLTYLWITGLAVLTITLIYLEQTAILYILATLGVTALLVVVAVADLKGTEGQTLLSASDAGATPANAPAKRADGKK